MKKLLVCGIIFLFIGVCILPCISAKESADGPLSGPYYYAYFEIDIPSNSTVTYEGNTLFGYFWFFYGMKCDKTVTVTIRPSLLSIFYDFKEKVKITVEPSAKFIAVGGGFLKMNLINGYNPDDGWIKGFVWQISTPNDK